MATRNNTVDSKTKQTPVTKESVTQETVKKTENKIATKDIDIHQYIPVKNGFQGTLVYTSKRTGEEFLWNKFGDEQEIELQELKNAKSSNKGFFERNWFMFDDEYMWVVDYLGVGAFYRNVLKLDDFDKVFVMSPDEIKDVVKGLSDGQKASLIYRARQLMLDNGIDSNKVIAALEESLGVQLVEH